MSPEERRLVLDALGLTKTAKAMKDARGGEAA
jgi:hypothetical protein